MYNTTLLVSFQQQPNHTFEDLHAFQPSFIARAVFVALSITPTRICFLPISHSICLGHFRRYSDEEIRPDSKTILDGIGRGSY